MNPGVTAGAARGDHVPQAFRRVVLASGNPGKLAEFRQLLAHLPLELLPVSDFHAVAPEESGESFVENAILKARHAAQLSGLPALADDSGLEVDILNGRPGIFSARYAGPAASDEQNLRRVLEEVEASGAHQPSARFQCAIAFMRGPADPMPVIAQGSWEGFLVPEPRGANGFGYDPIFLVPGHGCTSAELPPEVKNRISHRARAMAEFLRQLMRIADVNWH